MKLLDKILLAIDFSNSSDKLVYYAIELARTFQSKVTIMHVLPDEVKNEKLKLLLCEAAERKLQNYCDQIHDEGIRTEKPILEFGNHFDLIIQTAERIDTNMILVGAGEKSENEVFQLGTTVEKIIRKSIKPVWVIKNNKPLEIRSILCPVDFSNESKRALRNAITMAFRFKAKLVIFRCVPTQSASPLNISIDENENGENDSSDHLEEFNSFLKKFNLTDLSWRKEIRSGNPSEEILKALSRNNSDLLIMGTTGKSGLSRILMGSVTEKVIREVPCSFVTLKSEDLIKLKLEREIRDIESHYSVAKQLIDDGFYKAATNEFMICLNINDMHIPSLNGIAQALDKNDKPEEARQYRELAKEVLSRIWDRKIEAEVRKFYKF